MARRLGRAGRKCDPAIAVDLRQELREEIEETLEIAGVGERAELRRNDRVEECLVEMTGQPIADVDAAVQLNEEAVVARGLVDRLRERTDQFTGSSPSGRSRHRAGAVRPEAAAGLVAVDAKDDRHVYRRRFGPEQACKAGRRRCPASRDRRRWPREVRTAPYARPSRHPPCLRRGSPAPATDGTGFPAVDPWDR